MNPSFGGPHVWGGRGLGGGGMFGPFSGGMDSPEDPLRRAREDRILPALPALRNGFLPELPVNAMKTLVADLKEEGNSLFREKQYVLAGEYYTYALTLARNMEIEMFCYVERDLLSTIFSNRAACCLKLDYHDDAVRDTEYAISLNKDNIKAYFRKATALKAKKVWAEALAAAKEGQARANSKNKAQENKEFSEIIREISSHLPPPTFEAPLNFATATKLPPAPTQPPPGLTQPPPGIVPPAQPNPVANNKAQQPPPFVKTTAVASAVHSASSAGQQNDRPGLQAAGVDESWLQGTTVDVTLKAVDRNERERVKKKKKKSKMKTIRTNSANRFAFLERSESESESSDEEGEDKSESSDEDVGAANIPQLTQPLDRPIERPPKVNGFTVKQKKKGAAANNGFDMGLDDFAIPGGINKNITVPLSSSSGSVQSSPRVKPPQVINQQREVRTPPTVTVPQQQQQQPPPMMPISRRMKGPLQPYEFKLACSKCYVKIGEGILGYRHHPMLSHPCAMDILLLRLVHENGGLWLKIRPRPNRNFPGKYRMCQHFLSDRPCKVSEEYCSFAHSQAEIDAWCAEREGQIDLSSFITEQRNQVHAAASQRLAKAEAVPPPPPPQNTKMPLIGNVNSAPRPPRFQPQPQQVQEMPAPRIPFPLKDHYNFKLACQICLRPSEFFGFYILQNVTHDCSEEILAVQEKGFTYWAQVRERKNHRMFPGNYMECRYFCDRVRPMLCPVGIENCSFAHNVPEQILWTLEKDGIFNIQEFMIQNKTVSQGLTVAEVFHKHKGHFRFLCGICFFGHLISFQRSENDIVCSNTRTPHPWLESRVLVHVSHTGNIELIANRPFTHKTAFYLLCHRQRYCPKRVTSECKFAHSLVERDVWVLERDTGWSRDTIVKEYSQLLQIANPLSVQNTRSSAQHSPAEGSPVRQPSVEPVAPPVPERCPYRVIAVCSMCWKNGVRSEQDGNKDRCNAKKRSHIWSLNIAYLLVPQNKIIRQLPKKIPSQLNFILCRHIREKRNCDYSAGTCQFAHSEEEIEIWKWMVRNQVKKLEDLLEQKGAASSKTASPAKKISEGQSVVTAAWAQQPAQLRPQATTLPLDLVQNAHYCHYCSVSCNSEKQWVEHCASDKHMFNVNSDKEHQWNYRQPPWGISANQYELCPRHQEGRCRYSHLPDMYNLCKYAHSQEELDEWKERWEWRQMKREMARQEGVYSYMEELLEDFDEAQSALSVITEQLPDVEIKVTSDLKIYKQDKNATHSWDFYVCHKKGLQLERVALLQNKDRLHFVLFGEDLNDTCQIASGDSFLAPECSGNTYKVRVLFKGGMFGSFMQWVSFDFGGRPVLVRKLNVELGVQDVQEKVKQLREKLNFDRWTAENREIVTFDSRSPSLGALEVDVLKTYKAPTSADAVVNQQTLGVELNRHNYVHKMSKMLQLEELTRHRIISSYNLKTKLELISMINESTLIYVRSGELFARVPLNNQLSEDTDAGKLILTSVRNILIAPNDSKNKQVYEAIIVQKDNFDYDGRGKDYIYICLSQRCCSDLELSDGGRLDVEIQFQMNRLPFCFMHYALSRLDSTDKVFPDVSKVNPEWHEKQTLAISSSVLNNDQIKVIKHVIAQRVGYTPPLILYGPFGTGKTETLAQAALLLLEQKMDVRILICTHSNSAADLYILKHFDEYTRQNKQKGLPVPILRVYALERRLNTVPPQIQSYCLISHDRTSFVAPTAQDVKRHQVVITTLHTSLVLSQMGLSGAFTHIFIDEAGQALETELIMPLTLATEQTCIVLAGDHMQMSPHVYSREARRQGFHRSLLERLYRHYEAYARHLDITSPLNILLSVNYRSKMEILRFISAVFYGSPDALKSRSAIPNTNYIPLTFYAAQGREVQDSDSTSYYNMAEIEEVVDRVEELYENWPSEWGPRKGSSIGVVTPYFDQVSKIRVALRRRKRELREVTVERVMNVQGKEFQALFISTVRTRHIADTAPRRVLNSPDCDGEVGDFGFLSDPKLLNTAFTRAQSMVAVVGDPVALCSIGECMSVWRTFLKHCQNLKSIYPNNFTLDLIKSQVVSLMNTPEGENLRQLALLYRSVKQGMAIEGDDESDDSEDEEGKGNLRRLMADEYEDQNPFDTLVKGGFFEDWSLDYHVEPDDIIKQLAKEVVKVRRKSSNENRNTVQNELEDTPLKIECIKVEEEEGHAVVTYDPNKSTDAEPRKRRLRGADDCDADFDSDSDISDNEDVSERMVYTEYSVKQLNDFLLADPAKYKHCIFKIENSQRMYAKVVDATVLGNKGEIKICSRLHCGRAFNNDEVVVEIINRAEEEEEEDQDVKDPILVGKVMGILKRSINPKYRMFVCRVEQDNTGLMVPLNRGIPKIYNLETHNRMMKSKKGHVCVYTFTKDKEIIFHHYEPVDCTNPDAKLFIVRYLKWEAKFYSPLGIVVGVLPAGDTVENGMKILNIEHYVSHKFKEETVNDIDRYFHSSYVIPETAYMNRVDYRSKLTFTVDPPGSEDLDDALSIEAQPNSKFVIGVHIADVSYFIKKDSYLDTEAKSRGMTFYPVGEKPVHMIPERLATDLCSLHPNKDRLVLSLFITVNHEGAVERVQTRRCVIRTKFRLTYRDVENILKRTGKWDTDLMINVFMLHRIAQMWRRKRLGNLGLYQQFDPEASQTPEAHLMVEEIMINTNHLVAELLLQKFSFVPLRNQLNPNDLEMDAWRVTHNAAASNSLALKNPYLPLGALCRCQGVCTCVPVPKDDDQPVSLSLEVVEKLKDAVTSSDPDAIKRLVLDPLRHPNQAVALIRLWQIQERSSYVCSGDIPEHERRHHSLNLFGYTHFTSPIRRYIDLVVHRMVAAHIDSQPSPYSQNDIRSICDQMTDVTVKATRYEQATHSLHLSAVLQKHSIILYPVVESITEQHIQLSFPTVGDLTSSKGRVKLSYFNPSERPAFEELAQSLELKFSWRIYDNSKERTVFFKTNAVQLNPSRFTMQISREVWQQMIEAIQQDDRNALLVMAVKALQELQLPGNDGGFGNDVSSEIPVGTMINHFSQFNLKLEPCAVMRVQVGADLCKGFLSPRIQLVNLTPRLDICLEHRSDPISCFAGVTNIQASKQNYGDVDSYQKSWLPVLAMEAARNAGTCEEAALIHSVDVKWHVHRGKKGNHYTGSFSLSTHFCSNRQLRFSGITGGEASPWGTDEEVGECPTSNERVYDFLCIRYRDVVVHEQPDTKDLKVDIDLCSTITWVGHCLSTKVIASKKESLITVYFKLHHSTMPFPEDLLQNSENFKATVEWIPKSLPYRRMEKGLYDLSKANQLVQDIAMGRNPEPRSDENYNVVRELLERDLSPMNVPNQEQQRALQTALLKPFTLIQGPPGTGKTVTSARLAVLYVLMNRIQPFASDPNSKTKEKTSPQILYCGPSNKSVDVVAGYLKRLGHQCPRLVRVYGESIERQEFPLPNDPSMHRRKTGDAMMDPSLKGIALHHLIRMEGKKNTRQICEYDEFFRIQPEQVSQEQVADYLRLVGQAEAEEIMNAEIILCTASSASAAKIRHSSNVTQIIVDECGMCTELETLIPLVAHNARQVVLVGDHQQLRPIVMDDTARNLGLERSMFERYSDKAIMLTTQYRMHEAISYFPSHHFYKDLLQCGRNEQTKPSALKFWPNGRDQPIAFIHVAGKEQTQSVATADGSEQSKSNILEATQATRVARLLVRRFHVRPEDVVVLTQYRAQAAEVQRQLLEKGEPDISVSTVVASQGSEWDYVVLSTVRSLPLNEIEERPTNGWRKRNLGFIMDAHQINVGITRARKGLIIIGNRYLLQCDEMWKNLLDYYDMKKKITDAKDFMALGK